jgi:hypothetical protein
VGIWGWGALIFILLTGYYDLKTMPYSRLKKYPPGVIWKNSIKIKYIKVFQALLPVIPAVP